MFTGIITDVGQVQALDDRGDRRMEIASSYEAASIELGASIACGGACLTVVDKAPGWFAITASAETLSKTTLSDWRVGTPVNLERAMRLGDELGGHLVTGHVDGVGTVVERRAEGDSVRIEFAMPKPVSPMIAVKGSITVDGVSLTVNEADDATFGVNLIPFTLDHTTLGALAVGSRVNLEIDLLARYVARLLAANPKVQDP